jgi:hypothetical protein
MKDFVRMVFHAAHVSAHASLDELTIQNGTCPWQDGVMTIEFSTIKMLKLRSSDDATRSRIGHSIASRAVAIGRSMGIATPSLVNLQSQWAMATNARGEKDELTMPAYQLRRPKGAQAPYPAMRGPNPARSQSANPALTPEIASVDLAFSTDLISGLTLIPDRRKRAWV